MLLELRSQISLILGKFNWPQVRGVIEYRTNAVPFGDTCVIYVFVIKEYEVRKMHIARHSTPAKAKRNEDGLTLPLSSLWWAL